MKINSFREDDVDEAERVLQSMIADVGFNTKSSYSTDTEQYPDNSVPFIKKHMDFLHDHPNIDPRQYISNLRLMTRTK